MKYVLFDLDGTLVDTSEGILDSIRLAAKELGIENIDVEDMKRFIGPPLKDAFMEFCGMNPKQAADATRIFRKYYEQSGKYGCKLYPQMAETLASLKQSGYVLFVATSKPTVFAIDILHYLNIGQYFDEIVGSNLDNTRSTKREVIAYILEKYQIRNLNQSVMVGDKAQDLVGAKCCGIHGIGVTYGFGSYEELVNVEHDALLAEPYEIIDFLEKWDSRCCK